MDNRSIATVLLAGLLAGAIASYTIAVPGTSHTSTSTSISTTTQTTTTTIENNSTTTIVKEVPAGTNLASVCETQQEVWGPGYGFTYPRSLAPNSSYPVPVLLMQPNTTAYMCVVWLYPASNYSPSILEGLPTSGIYIGMGNHPPSAFVTNGTIPNSTSPFISNATAHYVSVVYSITALNDSIGFYHQSAPLPGPLNCDWLPMAVGYSFSQVNASDFTGYGVLNNPCAGGGGWFAVEVGVSQMQMKIVEMPLVW